MVAGTSSGCGKTTVATGLMAALSRAGLRVAAAKVGPDFIDPSYHSVATGRPGRNLDPWLCGRSAMAPLAARAAAGADILVVEGVMGLFDGTSFCPERAQASTAEVARLIDAPVVLVVDASSIGQSVAALVQGFCSFDPEVRLAGVVLNRVGGPGHEEMLRCALAPLGLAVLGALPRRDSLSFAARHLGLIPAAERPRELARALRDLGELVGSHLDLEALVRLAASAPRIGPASLPEPRPSGRARVAVAQARSLCFYYPDNLEALAGAGAELCPFDPEVDPGLPEGTDALYVGGGFPEVFGPALSANRPLLAEVARRVSEGMPVWAECGGMMWLSRSLDGAPMVGALDASCSMTDRLTLGYRQAEVLVDSPLAPAGEVLVAHEFHYSETTPAGSGMRVSGRSGQAVAGHLSPSLFASYLHLHLGADPRPAERFVARAAQAGRRLGPSTTRRGRNLVSRPSTEMTKR